MRLTRFLTPAWLIFSLPCAQSVWTQSIPVEASVEATRLSVSCTVFSTLQPKRVEHVIQFKLEGALAEDWRSRMDTSLDGNISLEESQAFLRELSVPAATSFRARLDGAALTLVPLQEPEFDYGQDRGVNDCPLVLHLAFVCTLPRETKSPQQLILESRFLPQEELRVSWEAQSLQSDNTLSLVGQINETMPPQAEGAWRPLRLPLTGLPRTAAKSREVSPDTKDGTEAVTKADPRKEATRKKLRQRIEYFKRGPIERTR